LAHKLTDETSRLIAMREPAEERAVHSRDVERFLPAVTPGVAVQDPRKPTSQWPQLIGSF
jgi:hypothetical protein